MARKGLIEEVRRDRRLAVVWGSSSFALVVMLLAVAFLGPYVGLSRNVVERAFVGAASFALVLFAVLQVGWMFWHPLRVRVCLGVILALTTVLLGLTTTLVDWKVAGTLDSSGVVVQDWAISRDSLSGPSAIVALACIVGIVLLANRLFEAQQQADA